MFDSGGNLRPAWDHTQDMAALGVGNDTVIIPWCTGGIRSAFLYAVLRWVGLNPVVNYDGSWWDWAGNPNLPVGTDTGGTSFG
jgi:thiosulfate/3-mercaptopyruvate sulfurtransferase